jgi:hypothetical protein
MMDEMPVPTQSTNQVDLLAERYRAAFDKTERTRKQFEVARSEWIEATLELGEVILEARRQYPGSHAYSRWLVRNNLRILTPSEITAHAGFARDPEAGRKMLQASTSYAVRSIWEKVPKRELRSLPRFGKGAQTRHSRHSGHLARQRAARIPDVMQDKPRPLDVVRIKGLTREEVDPDFKGTALEFATKHGHVNLHTKAESEHSKRQDALQKGIGIVMPLVGATRPDLETLAAWAAKPGKAAKARDMLAALRLWVNLFEAVCPEPKEQIASRSDLPDPIADPAGFDSEVARRWNKATGDHWLENEGNEPRQDECF